MAPERPNSLTRFIWPAAGLILVLAVVLTPTYLVTRRNLVLPAKETLAAVDRQYLQIRSQFPGPTTATTFPISITTQTTELLQARCDRLFLEITEPIRARNKPFYDSKTILSKVGQALQLAAMYDLGVRVSDGAKADCNLYDDAIQWLGYCIERGIVADDPDAQAKLRVHPWSLNDPNPAVRAKKCADLVTALKFLRVVECPAQIYSAYAIIGFYLYEPSAELMPELKTLDLELLAPRRRPIDMRQFMLLALDSVHEHRKFDEQFLNPAFAFRSRRDEIFAMAPNMTWYQATSKYIECIVDAALIPTIETPENIRMLLNDEKEIQAFIASPPQAPFTPTRPVAFTFVMSDQLHARLLAGAIELRRGAPVPSPGQIGPDSYFFNPITQTPYEFSIERETPSLTRLYISQPISNQTAHSFSMLRITLPSTHPGLASLPNRYN